MTIFHHPNEFEIFHGNVTIFVFEFRRLLILFKLNVPFFCVFWWRPTKEFPVNLKANSDFNLHNDKGITIQFESNDKFYH